MRLLLFIPVLLLFLSNVPFEQRLPMETAIAMMQENQACGEGTCARNQESLKASCSSETDCTQPAESEKSCGEDDKSNCGQTENTCVCIYCFQYVAPLYPAIEFRFATDITGVVHTVFIPTRIKDPHTGAPWQPPDANL